MMNILSQIVQSGNNKVATSEESNLFSENADKKGMGQKFTQLMMGLLGMESESDISKEGLLPDEAKTEHSELSQLIDSDVAQLSQEVNADGEIILSVKIDGEEIPNADSGEILQLIMPGDKGDVRLANGEKIGEVNSLGEGEAEKVLANLLSKSQQGSDSEAGKQAAEAKILKQISEHIGAQKPNPNFSETSTKNILETAERLIQTSQNKSGDTSQNIAKNTEAAQTENSGKMPLSLKDFPGITFTASENQQAGKGQDSKIIPQSAKGEILKQPSSALQNVFQALSESADGEQQKSTNAQKASPISNSEQKSSQASASDQKHPVLKDLMNQSEESSKSVKAQVMKQASAESATKSAQQASSGKAAFSNLAQNYIPLQAEQSSFKSMPSTSPQVALDPSKITNMEADNGAELEMELQSQGDKDTSANDESRSSLRMRNMTMSQMMKSSGRREFSAQLVRQIQQQAEQAKAGANQKWSHHRFLLDDGEAVNLSVRQGDGAMQLQLGAGNSELNKIIQQHINEIRQHLQEQLDVEIDLQLQHFGEQEAGDSSEDSQNDLFGNGIESSAERTKEGSASTRSARYLGFNNNEWTA